MNAVSLIGRLTKDLVLRETNNRSEGSNKYVFFTLAVGEYVGGKENTNFIPCVAWGVQAENMARFLHKGSQIGVMGRIRVRELQENGQYQTRVNIQADRVEFLENRATTQQRQQDEENVGTFSPLSAIDLPNLISPSETPASEMAELEDDSILWD